MEEEVNNENQDALKDYVQGSIKRIHLIDFMSHADVLMEPGPRFNIIMGHNGSGKSSIVCAIALGLGGDVKDLGRGDKLFDFIRHERPKATIEIDLADDVKKKITIKCEIQEEKRFFSVDGKNKSLKEIKDLMSKNHVQVGNLCQFLPQDRVSAFVEMNDQQRLKETIRAIKDESLVEEQAAIAKLQLESTKSRASIKDLDEKRETLAKQKEIHLKDKVKYEQYHQFDKENKRLKLKLAWQEYFEAETTYKNHKAETHEAKAKWEELLAEYSPLESEVDRKQTKCQKAAEEWKELKKAVKIFERVGAKDENDFNKKFEKFEDDIALQKKKLDGLEKQKEKLQVDKNKLEDAVKQLEIQYNKMKQKPPEVLDFAELKRREEKAKRDLEINEANVQEITNKSRKVREQMKKLEPKISDLEVKIAKAKGTGSKRLEAYKKMGFVDVRKALQLRDIIDQSGSTFKQEIYGPLILEVICDDPLHQKYLEKAIVSRVKNAFVTQNSEDKVELDRLCREKNIHSLLLIMMAEPRHVEPWNLDAYKNQGLSCTLNEVYDAPPIVKTVLNNLASLHNLIVGSDVTQKVIEEEKIPLVKDLLKTPGKNFITIYTPKYLFSTSGSKYSSAMTSKRTSIRNATLLNHKLDDKSKLDSMDAELMSLQRENIQLKQQDSSFTKEMEKLKKERDEIKKALELSKGGEKAMKQYKLTLQQQLGTIERRKRDLKNKEEEIKDFESTNQVEEINIEIDRINKNRVEYFGKVVDLMEQAQNKNFDLDSKAFEVATFKADYEDSKKDMEEKYQIVGRARTKFDKLKSENQEVKMSVTIAREAAVDINGWHVACPCNCDIPVDCKKAKEKEWFLDLQPEKDGIEWKTETITEKMEQAADSRDRIVVNQASLQQFAKIEEELKKVEEKLKLLKDEFNAKYDNLDNRKANWVGDIKNMVDLITIYFRDYMKAMKCSGEIVLDEGPEGNELVDKFGIAIKVSFRSEHEAVKLNAQQQSGGEKSISTIMYLLSLQKHTEVAFRVVDEINQGMDTNYERLMYQRIMETSCTAKGAQCFLITPKLLADLEYNPQVTLHFVFNTPLVEVKSKDLNFSNLLKRKRERASISTQENGGNEEEEKEKDESAKKRRKM